jgi:O-6-methylguanine DNA methyltransferase
VTALTSGPLPKPIADALDGYFSGNLAAFAGLALNSGGSDFQRKVWAALCAIPAGQTRSYGDLAASIGQPRAARAVGLANGANPIGIIVPCHRVIGSNGTLTGYAGGVERKAWLLRHEGALAG